MQKSLFIKYFAVCSAMILLSISLMGGLFLTFSTSYFMRDKEESLSRNAAQAASITASNLESHGYKFISEQMVLSSYRLISATTGTEIFLTDADGHTLICTEGENCNHRTYSVPEFAMEKVLAGQYVGNSLWEGVYDAPHYIVGVPLTIGEAPYGAVFVSLSSAKLTEYVVDLIDMFFLCAIIAVFVSSVVIYFVTRRMVKPLRTMALATKSFSMGDFSVRVPVDGADEIAQLANAFNNMATSLADLESVRRNFIANVSHELKTPMTTIGGFIDGIIDGTVPEEKRSQYLTTVSEEVHRLSRMVKSMLNIARIESGEAKTDPTVFDINGMVCRTLFAFEQRVEERHLEIMGLLSDPIYVEADEDLINQVVYNLLDNAVKFVNEKGRISFSYKTENGRVFVAVRNTGEGIPQHEIPRLFDRFYKSDKSRSLDKSGYGLGLYIVQTIVNLHEGDLIVRSVEGEYVEFCFSLPAADGKAQKEHTRRRAL